MLTLQAFIEDTETSIAQTIKKLETELELEDSLLVLVSVRQRSTGHGRHRLK
jgi:hypothetical protein